MSSGIDTYRYSDMQNKSVNKGDQSIPPRSVTIVYDVDIPSVIPTGAMGACETLMSAKRLSSVIEWADRAYSDPEVLTSYTDFSKGEHPTIRYSLHLCTIVGLENNSGLVACDAYVYAYIRKRGTAEYEWRLIAVGRRVVGGSPECAECAYTDFVTSSLVIADRRGVVHGRMKIPRAMKLLWDAARI